MVCLLALISSVSLTRKERKRTHISSSEICFTRCNFFGIVGLTLSLHFRCTIIWPLQPATCFLNAELMSHCWEKVVFPNNASLQSGSTVTQKPQSHFVKVEEEVVGWQRGVHMARREASELSVSSQDKRLSVNGSYFLKRPNQ